MVQYCRYGTVQKKIVTRRAVPRVSRESPRTCCGTSCFMAVKSTQYNDDDDGYPPAHPFLPSYRLHIAIMQDRDVRLLVACCLVEVLRIYAPEPPYTEKALLAIFSFIITELRGLCTAVTPGEARTVREGFP